MQEAFDPFTNGHQDIVVRSLGLCDKLIIAIGFNPGKTSFFSVEERLFQIKEVPSIKYSSKKIQIDSFQGLLVDYAKSVKANVLIRGIRSVSDFEYEINLSNINKKLATEIETIFLPTSPEMTIVSSSMVKEIARLGGDISDFVPDFVNKAIKNKFGFVKTGE